MGERVRVDGTGREGERAVSDGASRRAAMLTVSARKTQRPAHATRPVPRRSISGAPEGKARALSQPPPSWHSAHRALPSEKVRKARVSARFASSQSVLSMRAVLFCTAARFREPLPLVPPLARPPRQLGALHAAADRRILERVSAAVDGRAHECTRRWRVDAVGRADGGRHRDAAASHHHRARPIRRPARP